MLSRMSDPWSNPPGGGDQPPPPPPPPPTPSWSTPPPPPSYGGTPGAGPGTGYGPTPAYMGAPGTGQKTNTLAIVALVTGILGICCGFLAIAGVVTGVMGRNQIKASNGLEKGDGMALAGIILGAIGLVLWALWIVVQVAVNA